MKRCIALIALSFTVFSLFAADLSAADKKRRDDPAKLEVEEILRSEADTVISGMTFADVQDLLGRLSVPMQEAAYVKASRMVSMMMPGRGQFMNDDVLSGVLFAAADLAVAAGTIVGGYFLLPPELQFDNLDYFNTPLSEIKEAWRNAAKSATFMDALPTMGVMAGGMILHRLIAGFSAHHAGNLAQDRIDKGIVTFEPITTFSGHGFGRFGFRMGFKF